MLSMEFLIISKLIGRLIDGGQNHGRGMRRRKRRNKIRIRISIKGLRSK